MRRLINAEQIDSGSNYNFPDKMEIPRVSRSVFNLSHKHTTTIDNAGIIFPIAWFEYVPTDSFDISINHFMRVMPQVVPLFSNQRMFIHAFACAYTDLQSDFEVLLTKGYNGNTIKRIAPLTEDNIDSEIYNNGEGVVEPCSLADYLGLPQGAKYSDLIAAGVSALPFMMFESIYKNYYMNFNYYIENRNWLPDDPETFRLNENGVLASNTDTEHPYVKFGKLHYRDYPDDYFTSCLPFAQRGDRPTLSLSLEQGSLFNLTNPLRVISVNSANQPVDAQFSASPYNLQAQSPATSPWEGMKSGFIGDGSDAPTVGVGDLSNMAKYQSAILNAAITGTVSTSIGLEELRQLARQQVELEKAARTDGSYKSFGLTFFGVQPKTRDCRPLLIGSTYSAISFTEVLQTSQSSVSSALGQIAGHGISVNNNGFIGHFEAGGDFGLIMILGTIMPDVAYHQGLDKKWTKKYQSELYLPERAKMGLQPVYNKEIMFTGDSSSDDDLFGYQNPYDDLRYIPNRISGKIADFNNLSFSPYTQTRHFDSVPTLSQSFAEASDVRKDYLFAPSENAYAIQFNLSIRGVRPLPYKPVPNNFGF